jgi:predicted metal-dependent HD superfamily phosphohydrolase
MQLKFRHNYVNDFFDLTERPELKNTAEIDFIENFEEIISNTIFAGKFFDGAYKARVGIAAHAVWHHMLRPGLHYHTPIHVLSMLQVFQDLNYYPHIESAWGNLLTAVLFHDAVYVPGSSTNEQESVDFMKLLLEDLGNPLQVKLIGGHIMDTAKYAEVEVDPYKHCVRLMDLDLCNFAFPYESYNAASNAVMREFIPAGAEIDEVAKKRRANFLVGLLQRPSIYRTQEFKRRFEQKARENICKTLRDALN